VPTRSAICPKPAIWLHSVDRLAALLTPQALLALPVPGRTPSITTYQLVADLYRYCQTHYGHPTRAALARMREIGLTPPPNIAIQAKWFTRTLTVCPRLVAHIRCDVVAAMSRSDYERFEDRIVVIWPGSPEELRLAAITSAISHPCD
jgi:hypothetical protein